MFIQSVIFIKKIIILNHFIFLQHLCILSGTFLIVMQYSGFVIKSGCTQRRNFLIKFQQIPVLITHLKTSLFKKQRRKIIYGCPLYIFFSYIIICPYHKRNQVFFHTILPAKLHRIFSK